eukprot:834776-Prymnesium_polylepis.1
MPKLGPWPAAPSLKSQVQALASVAVNLIFPEARAVLACRGRRELRVALAFAPVGRGATRHVASRPHLSRSPGYA